MQYDKILEFMEEGKEYGIWDFCDLLGLKERYIQFIENTSYSALNAEEKNRIF